MRFAISLRKLAALNFLAAAVFGALAFRASAAEAMTVQAVAGPPGAGELIRPAAPAPRAPRVLATAS